jgi:hypothetical protein
MKNYFRISILIAALLFLVAGKASADTILSYDFTGAATVTFQLSQTPTPASFTTGVGFEATPINLMINGVASSDVLVFYNSAFGGAFGVFCSTTCVDVSLAGPQLYSGTEANPFMLLVDGVTLTNFGGPGGGSISNTGGSTPAPEPSAFLLLGIGLVALVGASFAAKRSNRSLVAAN